MLAPSRKHNHNNPNSNFTFFGRNDRSIVPDDELMEPPSGSLTLQEGQRGGGGGMKHLMKPTEEREKEWLQEEGREQKTRGSDLDGGALDTEEDHDFYEETMEAIEKAERTAQDAIEAISTPNLTQPATSQAEVPTYQTSPR